MRHAERYRLPAAAVDAASPTSFHSPLDAPPANFWPCGLSAELSVCAIPRWPVNHHPTADNKRFYRVGPTRQDKAKTGGYLRGGG